MSDLDFSDISDDQLVELARAIALEAVRRSPAMQAAFDDAIVSEAERLDAEARGGAAAKQRRLAELQSRAEREAIARMKREEVEAWRASLLPLAERAAQIVGRRVDEITVSDYHDGGSRKIRVTLGPNVDAGWFLIEYNPATDSVHTSPGVRPRAADALAWAREFAAAKNQPGARGAGITIRLGDVRL